MIVHVATYAPKLPRLLAAGAGRARGAVGQPDPLAAARRPLAAGLVLATLTYHLSGQWSGFSRVTALSSTPVQLGGPPSSTRRPGRDRAVRLAERLQFPGRRGGDPQASP